MANINEFVLTQKITNNVKLIFTHYRSNTSMTHLTVCLTLEANNAKVCTPITNTTHGVVTWKITPSSSYIKTKF